MDIGHDGEAFLRGGIANGLERKKEEWLKEGRIIVLRQERWINSAKRIGGFDKGAPYYVTTRYKPDDVGCVLSKLPLP